MSDHTVPEGRLPSRYLQFQREFPAAFKAYQELGDAVSKAGPLDPKTSQLVRLGVVVGARHEGAVHSHTRKALEIGCTPEEIRHAVLLSVTSIGFPNMMAAMSWVDDVIRKE